MKAIYFKGTNKILKAYYTSLVEKDKGEYKDYKLIERGRTKLKILPKQNLKSSEDK